MSGNGCGSPATGPDRSGAAGIVDRGLLISSLREGHWRGSPGDLGPQRDVRAVVIAPGLAGAERDLLASIGLLPGRLGVVADAATWEVLGRRVLAALPGAQDIVLDHPHADWETATALADRGRHLDGLITVGSGTLNDLCKEASRRLGIPCAVFATAPSMNGYVTSTASLLKDGLKISHPAHSPRGAFFDLEVLAGAPARLIRAGFGDVICRTTTQADWLLARRLVGAAYDPAAYALQAEAETELLDRVGGLGHGDLEAVARLTRLLVLGGFAMLLAGSSRPASQGEHLISHYLEMLADPAPDALHGEQVAVATWTMARLQAWMLALPQPPRMMPTRIDERALERRFGPAFQDCLAGLRAKALDEAGAAAIERRLARSWPDIIAELGAVMLPLERLAAALEAAGLATTAGALGIDGQLYRLAVAHARETRDRYTMLDLAADAGMLDGFAAGER
jgi:glycerol-1-phosphate dehydrogenase [NAD(P)+]